MKALFSCFALVELIYNHKRHLQLLNDIIAVFSGRENDRKMDTEF